MVRPPDVLHSQRRRKRAKGASVPTALKLLPSCSTATSLVGHGPVPVSGAWAGLGWEKAILQL